MLSEDQAFWFTVALFAFGAVAVAFQGWMRFLQVAIFTAVMSAALYWKWPGSGLAHGVVALLAVLFVTVLPVLLYDDARRLLNRWRERQRG